jgi:hypothetical protein
MSLQRVLDRVENDFGDFDKRISKAIERFKKLQPSKPGVTGDYEYHLQLEAAQIGVRTTLAAGSYFFENQQMAALSAQSADEYKLHEDPTGLFEALPIIEAAKRGDQIARHALHNKLMNEIGDDLPLLMEYKKYLIWLLYETREGKPSRGRRPRLNHARDRWIRKAVAGAMTHGFLLTRNRASTKPSAASLVSEALCEFGIHMTEANVELIAKGVDPKKSEE